MLYTEIQIMSWLCNEDPINMPPSTLISGVFKMVIGHGVDGFVLESMGCHLYVVQLNPLVSKLIAMYRSMRRTLNNRYIETFQ